MSKEKNDSTNLKTKATKNKEQNKVTKKPNLLHKFFGGLNMSWPVIIIFAVIMGIYTALMALLVPDGNSFHDIAVTPEWWVLPAIIIIINCKKPIEAALKVFVFFLISQPLVYLIQVPFNSMGWGLFNYYPYWFKITLCTLPAGFVGWYMKKDKWYSGLILSVMAILLIFTALEYTHSFENSFPNHLITVIYCIGIIPIFIFGIFRKREPRIISIIVAIIAAIILTITTATPEEFEVYRNTYDTTDGKLIELNFNENPYVSFWSSEGGEGSVEIINAGEGKYTLKITGFKNDTHYHFAITDDSGIEYKYTYYFDKNQDALILMPE